MPYLWPCKWLTSVYDTARLTKVTPSRLLEIVASDYVLITLAYSTELTLSLMLMLVAWRAILPFETYSISSYKISQITT